MIKNFENPSKSSTSKLTENLIPISDTITFLDYGIALFISKIILLIDSSFSFEVEGIFFHLFLFELSNVAILKIWWSSYISFHSFFQFFVIWDHFNHQHGFLIAIIRSCLIPNNNFIRWIWGLFFLGLWTILCFLDHIVYSSTTIFES